MFGEVRLKVSAMQVNSPVARQSFTILYYQPAFRCAKPHDARRLANFSPLGLKFLHLAI